MDEGLHACLSVKISNVDRRLFLSSQQSIVSSSTSFTVQFDPCGEKLYCKTKMKRKDRSGGRSFDGMLYIIFANEFQLVG